MSKAWNVVRRLGKDDEARPPGSTASGQRCNTSFPDRACHEFSDHGASGSDGRRR
jgi:hypothetical protein